MATQKALADAALPQQSLAVGEAAPLFTLPSSIGQPIALADHLARGPVVVAWSLFDFGRI